MKDTNILNMPKLDLHCHLDGSLSSSFVRSCLSDTAALSEDELMSRLRAPESCSSLTEYLTCFDLPILCLKSRENIKNAVLDVIEAVSKENVAYIEIRFAPTFSLSRELGYQDIFEAAIEGCRLGYEKYNVHSGIIACAMRHLDMDTNLSMLRVAREYLGNGVLALDLAGDESAFSNELFADLFKEATRLNMPFTIHSGECGSSENVRFALEAGAARVGHGIALIKDSQLMEDCKRARLGLELCPTSNYQTGAVKPDEIYPLDTFLRMGLLATVNTDNRTVSNTTLSSELDFSTKKLDIEKGDLIQLYKNSIEISFADCDIKNYLYKLI